MSFDYCYFDSRFKIIFQKGSFPKTKFLLALKEEEREHSSASRRKDLNTSVGTGRYVGMGAGSCLITSSREAHLLSNLGEGCSRRLRIPCQSWGPQKGWWH